MKPKSYKWLSLEDKTKMRSLILRSEEKKELHCSGKLAKVIWFSHSTQPVNIQKSHFQLKSNHTDSTSQVRKILLKNKMLSHVREMISFWISFKALDNAISQMGASFSEGVSPSSANSLPGNMFVILAYQKKKKRGFQSCIPAWSKD